ncbi:MAG: ABC transporter ATP-binding protein [SAR324 cluster bacterium]|nr:ABC transporter ATP-binding protein [SAR324 cluster bacterium]
MKHLLDITGLTVSYYTDIGRAIALNQVDLKLKQGEKLGLVGESGSGKSTMGLAMMRMIKPPGKVEGGSVAIGGVEMLQLSDKEMLKKRLSTISYIPQGAMNSLNPVLKIKRQMIDAYKAHYPNHKLDQVLQLAHEAMTSVELPEHVLEMYPHELSGGMKQRVCIAIGILLRPQIIIADEPTSALDVVTQRQVIETLNRVQQKIGSALILIGHDMGLMAQSMDKVAVMYAGEIVEINDVQTIFTNPKHPYTKALISSLPRLQNRGEFRGIPGMAPSLYRLPNGCRFHPRCNQQQPQCQTTSPHKSVFEDEKYVTCHLYEAS